MKPLSILALLFIIACKNPGSEKDTHTNYDSSYTLTGKIGGLEEGQVYIHHRQYPERKIDTADIHEGVFVFKGHADTPEFCNLGFLNNGQMDFRFGFFLQNGRLTLTARIDSLDDASVMITGAPTEDEFRNLSRGLAIIPLSDSLGLQRKAFIKEFAAQHPSSYVSAFEIRGAYGYNPDYKELDSIYNKFHPAIRTSYYGQQVRDVLEKARITDIGQPAPDFTLNDPDGRPIALSSFKGRYVLVDFWASWCGPCRRENPAVVKAYHRWHRKGFDILGISLDDNRTKWLEAIQKDSLTWTQTADLKGWQNDAARRYGIRGIPMNFLLDKKGKIIAKGLRGEELQQKLAALL